VGLSPLCTSETIWPIVPAPDDGERGAVGGMRIGRGNQSSRRKPAPVPLYSPQIPHDLACDRTRTAWAMAHSWSNRKMHWLNRWSWALIEKLQSFGQKKNFPPLFLFGDSLPCSNERITKSLSSAKIIHLASNTDSFIIGFNTILSSTAWSILLSFSPTQCSRFHSRGARPSISTWLHWEYWRFWIRSRTQTAVGRDLIPAIVLNLRAVKRDSIKQEIPYILDRRYSVYLSTVSKR
jgi:hypothetical protein